ncbi:unnamed protein product [Meloidogyne enterolobii]|uniref:Uncharacterized protein n=1 Tax=Meloidogyne enterolobii TaxID=390850 RepID=A0ACB0ZLM1_MELEN
MFKIKLKLIVQSRDVTGYPKPDTRNPAFFSTRYPKPDPRNFLKPDPKPDPRIFIFQNPTRNPTRVFSKFSPASQKNGRFLA